MARPPAPTSCRGVRPSDTSIRLPFSAASRGRARVHTRLGGFQCALSEIPVRESLLKCPWALSRLSAEFWRVREVRGA